MLIKERSFDRSKRMVERCNAEKDMHEEQLSLERVYVRTYVCVCVC